MAPWPSPANEPLYSGLACPQTVGAADRQARANLAGNDPATHSSRKGLTTVLWHYCSPARGIRGSPGYPDDDYPGGTLHQRSVVRVGAPLIIAALALSACGSRNDSTTGAASGNKIAVIGVMAPLSGDLSALGLGIQHSVELAVKQANANKTNSRLDAQGRGQGRRGQAGRRQERGDGIRRREECCRRRR